ncbi:MAG TPA: coproporphyrinogen-III oxidase family protein [Terriglobia bacterium]|nr:coproporphyrinogen-III oxidase family protein [Terriglobia bacterium]
MSSDSKTGTHEETEVGSYFVANYPPFSVWSKEGVAAVAEPAMLSKPAPGIPLGMYLHIPFCRKRCHFCYFRVYTDKNSDEIAAYLDTLVREAELYSHTRAYEGRPLNFVYFGGGTPSFLSSQQLENLVGRLTQLMSWKDAEEITFECEPGTLTEHKLSVIHQMGVTRLSLGIENFDDAILEANGRAHRSAEIFRAYDFARKLNFPQINIDLIAGMLGESNENWTTCVDKTIELAPDSVTIYQMELPYNTTISKDVLKGTGQFTQPLATWATKRRWVDEAFEKLIDAGYHIKSAYTLVRDPARTRFIYTDRLWQGSDLMALGVASFGHINGVHVQNLDSWEAYSAAVRSGTIPLSRAYRPTGDEKMIREFILQLKRGSLKPVYFENKYNVRVLDRFKNQLGSLKADGYLSEANDEGVTLSREGLLRVDSLLPRFFLPQHTGIRYT